MDVGGGNGAEHPGQPAAVASTAGRPFPAHKPWALFRTLLAVVWTGALLGHYLGVWLAF
jgi:hypothetical protein